MLQKLKSAVLFILFPFGIGLLSGLLTRGGMEMYSTMEKPPLSPPSWLFAPVWTILYILMGISSYIIYQSDKEGKEEAEKIYGYQLIVNFLWPVFFFSFQWYFFSFLWLLLLWGLVVVMIVRFYKISPAAGLLNIPYLLWLTFAAYLNGAIWLMK